MWRFSFALGICAGAIVAASGCSRPNAKNAPESPQNLRAIFDAYSEATKQLKRPPANLDELTPHLKDVGEIDKVLRSPDDGQKYVILWGAEPHASQAEVLAYEKIGKNGRRYVLRGHVVFWHSDEEFKMVHFPAGHAAPF